MKKILIRYGVRKDSEAVANFIGENALVILTSWSKPQPGLWPDDIDIFAWLAYPADKEDKVAANLQKYFVNPTA